VDPVGSFDDPRMMPWCFLREGRLPLAANLNWYGDCTAPIMFTTLTVPDMTLLFLGVVVGLTTALVWIFWEMEQRQRQRKPGHLR
jgi:hypothetical protein